MNGRDIAKLNKILKSIKINFPRVNIKFSINERCIVCACINGHCFAFRNVREFVRTLAFLNGAKFTPRALDICKKEKNNKKKEFFLYWVANCVNYGHQKWRTLEDLRTEFNNLYGLEIKQGRKKSVKEGIHSTECTEEGQIL